LRVIAGGQNLYIKASRMEDEPEKKEEKKE
jgi:hypothetical protein